MPLKGIYDNPAGYTRNKSIHKLVDYVKTVLVPRLTSHVLSELHGRVAYCVSCFLLVAMGAALGIVFRGGQLISAFTLSVIPAAFIIIMIIMGKHGVKKGLKKLFLGSVTSKVLNEAPCSVLVVRG